MNLIRICAGLALSLLGAVACASDPAAADPGRLEGTVVAVDGPAAGDDMQAGEVFLLRHPDDPRNTALRREPLRGGPAHYWFRLEAVPPGPYYLEACLSFAGGRGCVPYTTSERGEPTIVEVRPGRVTEVQIRF